MRPGDKGWLLIAVFVAGWDLLFGPDETLSQAALRHRRIAAVAIIYLAGHLLGVWPRQVDPLLGSARILRHCTSNRR